MDRAQSASDCVNRPTDLCRGLQQEVLATNLQATAANAVLLNERGPIMVNFDRADFIRRPKKRQSPKRVNE